MEIGADAAIKYVSDAEMVLVGIGEEFERKKVLEHDRDYCRIAEEVRSAGLMWVMPYVNTFWLDRLQDTVVTALDGLRRLTEEKNYFIVSVCMNGFLQRAGFRADRIVEPCGGCLHLQCSEGCQDSVGQVDDSLTAQIEACCRGEMAWGELQMPVCGTCGASKVFNSLYTQNYLEEGYLQDWARYKKWLQGTLNRKLCALELGVGLNYPSVIRWPFEKTVYFNKKAVLIRVHESLYQLTAELKGQGYCVPENAVDFLMRDVCRENRAMPEK